MPTELLLGAIALLTSAVAGILGFGGGMLLIAILPVFLHPATVIPLHGITQLTSNASRMLFSLKDVQWSLLPPFLIGSAVGIVLFGFLLANLPTNLIPVAIGLYILLSLWSERFSQWIKRYENFYLIGGLQTGLGLMVGATGPLALSVLTKRLNNQNQIIATSALLMAISHIAKILVFGYLGFSFAEHLETLLYLVTGAIIGSWLGTRLRQFVGNPHLIMLIKLALSLLAIKMIMAVV
ncbi:sulfite exporter TauE/SafE family protein [Photobacterium sp. TY1-4]|uniref:sulfite exporter TauE/SafE family protein n=1 Tax=Photobacterium sp. TY1-4 TaxID=2899122 RepID=UPI0021C04DBF|nr:sulfite exporter TauE/SafE family protein [Photobacterium sp. TY1-4]UXI03467.1 sulfite exporter TauE/SafE family protein [Photobacterium sp. TY1-4]